MLNKAFYSALAVALMLPISSANAASTLSWTTSVVEHDSLLIAGRPWDVGDEVLFTFISDTDDFTISNISGFDVGVVDGELSASVNMINVSLGHYKFETVGFAGFDVASIQAADLSDSVFSIIDAGLTSLGPSSSVGTVFQEISDASNASLNAARINDLPGESTRFELGATDFAATMTPVPIPPAFSLLGASLGALAFMRLRHSSKL